MDSTSSPQVKKKIGIITIGVVIILVFGLGWVKDGQKQVTQQKTIAPAVQTTVVNQDQFSYTGQTGKDALTLLKEKATVGQESSGLVSSINSRKADSGKHEFWAFYVNGKMAEVGPANYKTKDGDTIEWKIEKY